MKLVTPERVGMSTKRLARISSFLQENYIKPGKIAGTSTLVARADRLVYFAQEGLMDKERNKPMLGDTIFRIYSMTKPVTSIALMMLFEEGKFALNDPVEKYIPQFAGLQVWKAGNYPLFETEPVCRPLQIKDLLVHTAGFTYDFMQQTNLDRAYGQLKVGWPVPDRTLEDFIEQLAGLPLLFSPGEHWNYSVATDVVGRLVEVLSGQALDVFFQERIFGPLGMVDTGFEIPPEKTDRFAACYDRKPDKSVHLQDDPLASHYQRRSFLSGGGGLVSTMADYYRFCRMLIGGGALDGVRIIGARTLELMTKNHLPDGKDLGDCAVGSFAETAYDGVGFGLGFAVKVDAAKNGSPAANGQYFWGGLASTLFWVDPAEELVVIFMTQLIPSSTYNFRGQLEALVYGAIEGDVPHHG